MSKDDKRCAIPGYVDYQRREFCKDINCKIQKRLDELAERSPAYRETREICVRSCIHTTFEFHHWLIEKGYLIVRPAKLLERGE